MSHIQAYSVIFVFFMRFVHIPCLHGMCDILSLLHSKPPAPLNVCVIRGVFFCLKTTRRSLPAAPLNFSGNLLRNSGGFFMPSYSAGGDAW